jgi:hypothetical protein
MSGPRLSIIPAGAIFDRTLEPRDLQVVGLLGCYTDKQGWCRRSQVKMAKQLDCGRSSVQRSLDRLVEAGWVQKKRRDAAGLADDSSQPSASYEYRVVLDRDDFAFENAAQDSDSDSDDSYAENANREGECPPVGTPSGDETVAGGAQPDGHPGAHPGRAPGAHTYVGTKNDPLERPHLERERDARARDLKDRKARFIAAFEQRWPTAAVDDRQKTAYAAEALSEAEEEAALSGIGPFLEDLKRKHRKGVPAGWKYLEQKRWTLLEQPGAASVSTMQHDRASPEGKAIGVLFDVAGKTDFFHKAVLRGGVVAWRIEITPQLLALADVGNRTSWRELSHQQAGAWNEFIGDRAGPQPRRLVARSLAPKPWPPRKDGTWPPEGQPEATDEDLKALASEGQR